MKALILAVGIVTVVILIFSIIVISLKSKKKKPAKNNNIQYSKKSINDFHEDEMDYKTEALGSSCENIPNVLSSEPRNKVDFGKIPMLDKNQKNEVLNKINDMNSSLDSTGIFTKNTPYHGMEATQIMSESDIEPTYAVLEYLENGCPKKYEMKNNIINIGRDPKYCEIVIPNDNFMGRNHAAIYFKNEKFFIVDMNSKNGTFIDGERIEGCREIYEGCRLKIASTEVKFRRFI